MSPDRDTDVSESARRAHRDLFDTVWSRNTDLDPDEAMEVAYEELAAARAERRGD
jgi:hypothetical protein